MSGPNNPPLRIQKLELTDFRAFPGPAPQTFDLEGKNLLIHGENGVGKSSLFHALREFFSLNPNTPLPDHRNVFSGASANTIAVSVTFNDSNPPACWHLNPSESHPTSTNPNDLRVSQAALRRACLDYRALLDTNYKHGDNPINLFEIAVKHLLHDFPVTTSGGQVKTLGDLWENVHISKPKAHTATQLNQINQACAAFNTGLQQALNALRPHIGTLLGDLIGSDVSIGPFQFAGVTYNQARLKRDRDFSGQDLSLAVSFRNHPLTQPQHFLNEGRLSALALAIYLGGRLACTPTGGQALKLLLLDDVLIGLDHSNRLPVLDVLRKHFPDWQTILLTYDHVWFEMARFYLGAGDQWKTLEIHEGIDPARGIPCPTVRSAGNKAAQDYLRQAKQFLSDHHIPAAANYTRASFEMALKQFNQRHKIPVPYALDPRQVDTEALLSATENWLTAKAARACFAGVIERVKLFRKVVLNPYSHAAPPNIARAEVDGAIAAIEALLKIMEANIQGSPNLLTDARALLTMPNPSTTEVQASLGYIRAAFIISLRSYCERKHVAVPYSAKPPTIGQLWTCAKHPIPTQFVTTVENNHQDLLIDDVSDATLSKLTVTGLQIALKAIQAQNNPDKVYLDTL